MAINTANIFNAVGPTYKNRYMHGSLFQDKMAIYTTVGYTYIMAIYTANVFNAKMVINTACGLTSKLAIYKAASSVRKSLYTRMWLFTRLPGIHLKLLYTRQPFSIQELLYTRLPGLHIKMAIYTAAVFNATIPIYTEIEVEGALFQLDHGRPNIRYEFALKLRRAPKPSNDSSLDSSVPYGNLAQLKTFIL